MVGVGNPVVHSVTTRTGWLTCMREDVSWIYPKKTKIEAENHELKRKLKFHLPTIDFQVSAVSFPRFMFYCGLKQSMLVAGLDVQCHQFESILLCVVEDL